MSLRDQLLKAGLVSAEQVKQVESAGKKKKHQAKKDKSVARAHKSKRKAEQQAQQTEVQAKRDRDRRLNQERDAVRRRREHAARIRQMLKDQRVNNPDAEIPYNFSAGKVVRRVRVTVAQQNQLAKGQLAIVRNPNDEFDFPIVPVKTAEALEKIDPRLVLVKLDPNAPEDDWEWPE